MEARVEARMEGSGKMEARIEGWKPGWKPGLRDLERFHDLPPPDAQRRPRNEQIPGSSESEVSDPSSLPLFPLISLPF